MIFSTLKKVLSKPVFILTFVTVSIFIFAFVALAPNLAFLKSIFFNDSVTLANKSNILFQFFSTVFNRHSVPHTFYIVIVSLLCGLYVVTVSYFIKNRIKEIDGSGISLGFLGIVSGLFGMGCAACGIFLFNSISLAFISGLFPFFVSGVWFQSIGVLLLTLAIYITLKKISDPLVCRP